MTILYSGTNGSLENSKDAAPVAVCTGCGGSYVGT